MKTILFLVSIFMISTSFAQINSELSEKTSILQLIQKEKAENFNNDEYTFVKLKWKALGSFANRFNGPSLGEEMKKKKIDELFTSQYIQITEAINRFTNEKTDKARNALVKILIDQEKDFRKILDENEKIFYSAYSQGNSDKLYKYFFFNDKVLTKFILEY